MDSLNSLLEKNGKDGNLTDEELKIKNEFWNLGSMFWNCQGSFDGARKDGEHYFEITKDEMKMAYLHTAARKINNDRNPNVRDKFKGSLNDKHKGEFLGILAEIVVAREYAKHGAEFDGVIGSRRGGEDMIIKGKTIDVKCCMPHNNDGDTVVIEQDKQLDDADFYFFSRFITDKEGKHYINLYRFGKNVLIIDDNNKRQGWTGYWVEKEKLSKFQNVGRI